MWRPEELGIITGRYDQRRNALQSVAGLVRSGAQCT